MAGIALATSPAGGVSAFPTFRCSCVAAEQLVVVTRERGKNGKLVKALRARQMRCLELPLIEHTPGPDQDKLPLLLAEKRFQWITITSPEAASVFVDGWRIAGCPQVRIAVVGKGTKEVLDCVQENGMLEVAFVPSQANARVLAKELPVIEPEGQVLYPASAKASDELATCLTERGFRVCRLNTYSTEPVQNLPQSELAAALEAPVVTFASPSAVRGWTNVVSDADWNGAAACIGSTSGLAATKAGLRRVFYPENPGLEGWVESIVQAADVMQRQKT